MYNPSDCAYEKKLLLWCIHALNFCEHESGPEVFNLFKSGGKLSFVVTLYDPSQHRNGQSLKQHHI